MTAPCSAEQDRRRTIASVATLALDARVKGVATTGAGHTQGAMAKKRSKYLNEFMIGWLLEFASGVKAVERAGGRTRGQGKGGWGFHSDYYLPRT
jgi:hypothetical protein